MMKKGFTHESTYNESKEWYTPKYIFDALGLEFDLDPASPGVDIVPWIPARHHLTCLNNGLITPWKGKVWLNPPYGSDTPKWLKNLATTRNGIALVFSRTDTKWFHDYAVLADVICFMEGRVKFIKADKAKDYAMDKTTNSGTPGAGSLLLAYGDECAAALIKAKLGFTIDNRFIKKKGK